MRLLNRYIATTVLGSVAVVLLVIVGLDVISALVDELGSISSTYTFKEIVIYIGLTLPGRIYEQIPMSALIGCLVGLGLLAASSELTVMRAAGVSVWRITWGVMKPVLLFILLGIGLGEYVIPFTDQLADSRRAIAQGESQALQSRDGMWNREGTEFMHFNAVLPNGKLYGVTRYQFDENNKLIASSFAKSATYKGGHWLERDVRETNLTAKGTSLVTYPSREWASSIDPEVLNVLVLDPDELSIRSLYTYANYQDTQKIDSKEYQLAFWKKLLQPLATASLVLIAVSFIFGPLRSVTMGYRIFSGVIVGIVFRTSQDLLGPASLVFGFQPLIAVLAPLLVCFCVGIYLLRKAN